MLDGMSRNSGEIARTRKQVVSSHVKSIVVSELLYRDFEDHGIVVVGFKCAHCDRCNPFNGEDADHSLSTGNKIPIKVGCSKCKKESALRVSSNYY